MFIYFLKIIFWFILIIFVLALIESLLRLIIAFWKLYKTKFPFAKGFIPFFGHLNLIQSEKCPFIFSCLSPGKTCCAFRGTHPCLITSDPKLIKQICVKYSNHFHSRMIDPLSPNPCHSANVHIFGARGQRWKRQRTITSSALNTAKLRKMLPLILEETNDFIIYLSNYLFKQNLISFSPTEIEIHSLFQQLTASVIGRCALGLDKSNFENPQKHFQFFKQIFGPEPTVAMDSETFQWIIPSITKLFASINSILRQRKTPIDKLNDFIRELLRKENESKNMKPDILQNLKEFETFDPTFLNTENEDSGILNFDKISKADKLNTDEIISTIRFLSIAGFDTTANTLSFACFLLAENPEKLQKVFAEIESLKNEKLDYDTLTKAIYINSVLLETLRLFPHASMLHSRLTLTDCIIDNEDDKILIPSGVGILFDTWNIHHDPDYWGSDVNEFKPERHLSSNIASDYFIPFGFGPRKCIGMRFALMEQKAVLIEFFKHFTVKLPTGISSKNLCISLRNTGTVWPENLKLIIEKRTHFPDPA